MRAICCICSDRFDDASAVAAIPCGHTFHFQCISRWLDEKKSCPHCRNPVRKDRIIAKLFFDKADDNDESISHDSDRVANELTDLRVKLQQAVKDRDESVQNLDTMQRAMNVMGDQQIVAEKQARRGEAENASLRKKLGHLEAQNTCVMKEKEEILKVKQKMANMKMVERVLAETNLTDDLLSQHTHEQLHTYCKILKNEFEKTKREKKVIKSELDETRRRLIVGKQTENEAQRKNESLRVLLQQSEDDLKNVERERDDIRVKYERVKKSARFNDVHTIKTSNFVMPSNLNTGLDVEILSDESTDSRRGLLERCKLKNTTDKLIKHHTSPPSSGFVSAINTFTAQSPSLFDDSFDFSRESDNSLIDFAPTEEVKTPDLAENFRTRLRQECAQSDVSFVEFGKNNTTKMTDIKKRKFESTENNQNIRPLSTLNIFKNKKKKGAFCDYDSQIRTNYNGLGGHSTFTQMSRQSNTKLKMDNNLKKFLMK